MARIAPSACIEARIGRFARAEDGSLVIFGLFLLIGMLVIGGVGVDIMRHDYERLRMQSTLDTAILAAADLDQHRDPETVVRDFFDKAGMGDRVGPGDVTVTQNINSRVVSANASMELPTMFMSAVGIDSLPNATRGIAREDIQDIEISMVLDISGSMLYHNRIQNMRKAAKRFVTTVLGERNGAAQTDVSVNLVPYNGQVAIGSDMLSEFNLTKTHSYSACIDFVGSDFDSLTLNPSDLRRQTAHFDRSTEGRNQTERWISLPNLSCRVDRASTVRYMSHDTRALHDQIDDFAPNGTTSIDVGLRWGTALLDPSVRPAIEHLRAAGKLDNDIIGRPYDYDRNNTMKIVVLMTDGDNTPQAMMKDEFAGDLPSGVYMYSLPGQPNNLQFSVKQQENGNRDGDATPNEPWFIPGRNGGDRFAAEPLGGSEARELSFAELWATGNLQWNARYLRPPNGDGVGGHSPDYWQWSVYDLVDASVKNRRMTNLCNLAKDAGIIVFTIALDVSGPNTRRMQDCASTENHYFNVTGDEIVYAFSAIAGTINQLKLVQ